MSNRILKTIAASGMIFGLSLSGVSVANADEGDKTVTIIGMSDFHGALESSYYRDRFRKYVNCD